MQTLRVKMWLVNYIVSNVLLLYNSLVYRYELYKHYLYVHLCYKTPIVTLTSTLVAT